MLSWEKDVLLVRNDTVNVVSDLVLGVFGGPNDNGDTVASQRLVQLEGWGIALHLRRSHSASHVRVERNDDGLDDTGAIAEVLFEVDGVLGVVLERIRSGLSLGDGVEQKLGVGSHFCRCACTRLSVVAPWKVLLYYIQFDKVTELSRGFVIHQLILDILTKRGFKTTVTSLHAGLLINYRLLPYPNPGRLDANNFQELL